MLAVTLYHEIMPLFSHPLWTAGCTSVGLQIYTREHISRFCQNCHFLPFKCIKIVLNHNLDILYEYQDYGLIQKAWMILQFQREIKIQKIKKKLRWFIRLIDWLMFSVFQLYRGVGSSVNHLHHTCALLFSFQNIFLEGHLEMTRLNLLRREKCHYYIFSIKDYTCVP